MTKSIARKSNSQGLLVQLISNSALVKDIQSLDPVVLKKVIHHVGLEDSGELLMLLTSEQIQEVMDQDTWMSSHAGKDERLDAKRFCRWIEVLLEVGSDFAATKISEMDEDLLTAVLAQVIMALDLDELALMSHSTEDDEMSDGRYLDKALESNFNMEIDEYLVMSKAPFQWDTISNLLIGLQKDHQALVSRLLSRIRYVTLDLIEEFDGLYNLLKEEDLLEDDVSYERQQRREGEGFVAPSSASAFLKLIEQTSLDELLEQTEQDHISKMYFRSYKPRKIHTSTNISPELMKILNTHGVKINRPENKILASGQNLSMTKKYLFELRHQNETLFQTKLSELNFLANVVVSGYGKRKENLRPVEAMDLAFQACDKGLQYVTQIRPEINTSDLLRLFKIGWKLINTPHECE